MTAIAYSVICSIRYKSKEEEWLSWLRDGHIADVIKGGATAAEIIRRDPDTHDQGGTTYEIRYRFESRKAFDDYLEHHAPRLRKEGLERFPVTDGFHYQRTAGEIIG